MLQKKKRERSSFFTKENFQSGHFVMILAGMSLGINAIFISLQGIVALETSLGTLHIQVSVLCLCMLKRGETYQSGFCMLFGLLSFSLEGIRWGY